MKGSMQIMFTNKSIDLDVFNVIFTILLCFLKGIGTLCDL